MKHVAIILLALSPLLVSAQQPASADQLRKEMDAFKEQLLAQMKALQDSIASLKDQLTKERAANPDYFFQNQSPEGSDFFKEHEAPDWDHTFNFKFNFPELAEPELPATPDVPDLPVPPGEMYFFKANPYEFHYNYPAVPDVPEWPRRYRERNKMDEFLRMLPFYDWFKS